MPGYLLDTNVISELARPKPDDGVLDFLAANDNLWIPSIVVHEIDYGVELLPEGRRKRDLRSVVDSIIGEYLDRVIPIAATEASCAARLRAGRKVPSLSDSLVAGVALTHDLVLATRNTRHFKDSGIKVLNPFGL